LGLGNNHKKILEGVITMKKLILLFLSVTLLLSACSGGASMSASGAQAWLDQPVNGTVLPLGVFPLKAHARHASGSGITRIEFLVNGVPVGAVDTDAAAPLVYGEVNWNPSVPGEYFLAARAYAADGFSDSNTVRVCVSKDVKQAFISPNGGCDVLQVFATPTKGAAPTETFLPDKATEVASLTQTALAPTSLPPTLTPVPPTFTPIPPTFTRIPPTFTPVPPTNTPVPVDKTPPEVSITSISPSTLYYGWCDPKSGILTVEAYVSDAQSGISRVYLIYSFVGAGTEGIFADMNPIGSGYYRAMIDIGSQAYTFYHGANGSISIIVVAEDRAGNSAQADGGEVPLLYCVG
jgi:hypothetical protein